MKLKKIYLIIITLFFFSTIIFSCTKKVDVKPPTIVKENRKEAVDFTLQTLDGGVIQLSSFKGKVVLLDFWAEWCGPCKIAAPTIISLYKNYKDKGLRVFGVNLDDKKDIEKIISYVKNENVPYPTLLEGFPVAIKYGVTGIPKFVLIDKDGKIALEIVGAVNNLENILKISIESLLKE
ncbi:MAG: TlpA family protein disulfide reductase [Caldisericia bacterium]